MTATPDKRDDTIEGKNIYEIFNHKIAYEIRLQQAMEENMLCPFHYFGIIDISMLNEGLYFLKIQTRNNRLQHFKFIRKKSRFYFLSLYEL